METENGVKENDKFNVLFKLLNEIRPIWCNSNDYEKGFIETIIGAAIYYLPTNKKTFSGYISENCLLVEKSQRVVEHQYPRKISAKELLKNNPQSVNELKELYLTKYGLWNWVTKKENTSLKKYQKDGVFINPIDSYTKANIKLLTL